MAALPNFILKRLYVKNSLADTQEGCEFALRNFVGSGTLVGIGGVEVDGTAWPAEALDVVPPQGGARPGASVTPQAPLPLESGVAVIFRLRGGHLDTGHHALRIHLLTREMGMLEIAASDDVLVGRAPARRVLAERLPAHRVAEGGAAPQRAGAAASESPEADPLGPARPLRVAMIGAGSTVFARQLMTDILLTPGLEVGVFVLVDVDPRRLDLAARIGEKMISASGRRWKIEATSSRQKALPGCHYVINSIEVAGLRNVRHDYDIPLRFGVDQCIGDTIGPGGIFKMLRTGPAWLEIVRDIERLCPTAVVMNYSNPMSALTLLALRATRVSVVGLCHSVQNTAEQIASYLEVPPAELLFQCAGINHLAWYTRLTCRGEDMYPRLRERAEDPDVYDMDPVRFEVMKHFGAFVTESSGHLSEYLPYFRKRSALIEKYTRAEYRGESGFYANNWPSWRARGDELIREVLDGRSPLSMQRSDEYASEIIRSIEVGGERVVHGNVRNDGLIDNLPRGGCVEVPVLVDPTGVHSVHFGPLPEQMAALDRAHAAVHELMVQSILERSVQAARYALLLDPLTAAVCSPEEASAMFDEMWNAERADLAWFEK
jgi:alpha-galactosidase